MAEIIEDLRAIRRHALTPHNVDQVVRNQEVMARALALLVELTEPSTLNTIEAAALQAIREYYAKHHRRAPMAPRLCECPPCRKARTFASLIGVDLDKEE